MGTEAGRLPDEEPDVAIISSPRTDEESEESEEEGKLYLCRICGALITTEKERIEVDGGHEHTFVNPAGYIHRIRCFRTAPGCRSVGEPTGTFTWFARHTWSFAECRSCRSHLGWSYFRGAERRFYGLLVERLLLSGGNREQRQAPRRPL